jgi:hypothetical protein
MGLDMYLNASRYLSDFDEADKEKKAAMLKLFPELEVYAKKDESPVKELKIEVGYWRKANAIHNWFVWNVQNGEDDCKPYFVGREELETLKGLCQQVLNDNSLAEDLLPPTSGFFFGNTEVDEYYLDSLMKTVEIVDRTLALPDAWWIEYQSSW